MDERKIKKWITVRGVHVPIYNKSNKSLKKFLSNKKNIKIKSDEDKGTKINSKIASKVVKPKIKRYAKPKGNPELTAYGKYEGRLVSYTYSDYPSKEVMRKDMKANEITNIHIADKRDKYICDNTNFGNMSQIHTEYQKYKNWYKNYGDERDKNKADELKQYIDKANKIYLQKTKIYKAKKK